MHVAQSVQRLWDNDMHKTKLKEPRSKSDFERHSLSAFRSLRKSATHSRRDGAPGRPARSSSNRTIAICAALKPVWRMISSTPTGIGPSASSTSARSFSPGGGIADRPGASASGAPRGVRTPPSGASAPRTSAASVTSVGAVLEHDIAAGGARVERRARNGEGQPAHFVGEASADQRAGALRRFDHDQPECHAGDKTIAARKILRPRLPAERHFRNDGAAALGDVVTQAGILGRVGDVEAAGRPARQRCRSKDCPDARPCRCRA